MSEALVAQQLPMTGHLPNETATDSLGEQILVCVGGTADLVVNLQSAGIGGVPGKFRKELLDPDARINVKQPPALVRIGGGRRISVAVVGEPGSDSQSNAAVFNRIGQEVQRWSRVGIGICLLWPRLCGSRLILNSVCGLGLGRTGIGLRLGTRTSKNPNQQHQDR